MEDTISEGINSSLKEGETRSFKLGGKRTGCVLIHGFTGTPWTLADLGASLMRHNIMVSIPLLPGHGTKPSDLIGVSWKEWVKVCRIEVEKMWRICDEVFLIGLSMGGTIALLLATEIECNGVITLSAPVTLSSFVIKVVSLLRFFVKYWKKKPFSSSSPILSQTGYDRYPLGALLEFIKLLDYVKNLLTKVKCPVLIIHGKNDKKVNSSNAELIYNNVNSTDKQKIILDTSHHIITKGVDKEKVEKEILAFIRSHSVILR